MAKLTQLIEQKINKILGKGNFKRIKPYQMATTFDVTKKKDVSFIISQLKFVPFDSRVFARNTFNYFVKKNNGDRSVAQKYLEKLARYSEQMPINLSLKEEGLYLTINELANNCKNLIKSRQKINISDDKIILEIKGFASCLGIPEIKGKSQLGILKRYGNCKWWWGKLKPVYHRSIENVMRFMNTIYKKFQRFVSDRFMHQHRQNKKRNEIFLSSLIAMNDSGEKFELSEIVNSSLSNPKNRLAELKNRISGVEQYANSKGYSADFITITTPSRFHRSSEKGLPNINWDGSTIKDAQQYLNKTWEKVISKFHRDGRKAFGFRVVEPHHDGTPHWHLIIYSMPGYRMRVRDIIKSYFLADSRQEHGAEQYRISIKDVSVKNRSFFKGSYIVKNIGKTNKKLAEENSDKINIRANGWNCLWGFRQFDQFGGPPVNLWRTARSIAKNSSIDDNVIWKPVLEGDFCTFIELIGGVHCLKSERKFSLIKTKDNSLDVYGEIDKGEMISGLKIGNREYYLKSNLWKIKSKSLLI